MKARQEAVNQGVWVPSRRGLLVGAAVGILGWAGRNSALAQMAVSPQKNHRGNVLVNVFLRGGADGLNIVVPHGEDAYYRNRPTIAIAKPNRDGASGAVNLDGFFGLHPALRPLLPFYQSGLLGAVHAVGSDDQSRSHFEAMAAIDRGLAREGAGPSSGWLARHLTSSEHPEDSPLRAVAFGDTMPDSLRGASNAVSLSSLTDFKLEAKPDELGLYENALRQMYQPGRDEVAHAGLQTLSVIDELTRLDVGSYRAQHAAQYPNSYLGNGFKQIACLIRAQVGLEVACLDAGLWDTHVAQGAEVGWQATLLTDVGKSLAAFLTDLGPQMANVDVVVLTEFGRRVAENSGLGTDHGRAGMMLLAGGGVQGAKVHGKWPGLEAKDLDPTGDLVVTTDYRDVLGEAISRRLGNPHVQEVFPSASFQSNGFFRG